MPELPSTPADGNIMVLVVPAIASSIAPKLTETNAVSVKDISCYLTADGLTVTVEEASIADNRLCSLQNREKPGRSTAGLNLTYIDNTNNSDPLALNVAKDTLVPGTKTFILIRRGIAYGTALAVGQKVKIYPVQAGKYNEMPPEENSVLRITQKMFITSDVIEGVMVA